MNGPIGQCAICGCLSAAMCRECGAYCCDTVCASAHLDDHRQAAVALGRHTPRQFGRAMR